MLRIYTDACLIVGTLRAMKDMCADELKTCILAQSKKTRRGDKSSRSTRLCCSQGGISCVTGGGRFGYKFKAAQQLPRKLSAIGDSARLATLAHSIAIADKQREFASPFAPLRGDLMEMSQRTSESMA